MREAVFNTEVVNSLKAIGFWAYKIADSPSSWTASRTRFTPEKPADIIACSSSGKFILIEGKQVKKWQGFYKTALRENQIKSLDAIVKNRGKAYVFLNIRIAAKKEDGVKHENWCVIFDWDFYSARIKGEGFTIKEMKAQEFGTWIKGSNGLFDFTGRL